MRRDLFGLLYHVYKFRQLSIREAIMLHLLFSLVAVRRVCALSTTAVRRSINRTNAETGDFRHGALCRGSRK